MIDADFSAWDESDVAVAERPSAGVALLPAIPEPDKIFVANGTDSLVATIRATALKEAEGLDISRPADRKAIASLARKIATTKTAIDKAGMSLKQERAKVLEGIDPERRRCREALENLQVEIRKPLTDWENIDKKRIADHDLALNQISEIHADKPSTSDKADALIHALKPFRERDWQEFAARAKDKLDTVEFWLRKHHGELLVAEAEKLELDRLRKEAAERVQRERDEQIARDAAERAKQAAEAKAAADAAAADRKAKMEAQRAEEARKAEESARIAAEKRATGAEARAKADAERAVERERERVANTLKAERQAELKRQADLDHRAMIESEIISDMVNRGVDCDVAREVVALLAGGMVPHVRIEY